MWCMDSYAKFMELAMKPRDTGAYLRQSVFYFKDKVFVTFPNLSNKVYQAENHVLSKLVSLYVLEISSLTLIRCCFL